MSKKKSAVHRGKNTMFVVSNKEENVAMMKAAHENKTFLLTEETTLNGMKADWTHFEFMMAYIKFPPNWDDWRRFQYFWSECWPYIKQLTEDYEEMFARFELIAEDAENMVVDNANTVLELRRLKKWFKTLPNETRMSHRHFIKEEERKDEEHLEVLRKQEAERVAKEEKKEKKKGIKLVPYT